MRTVVFTIVNVGLTIVLGTLIALLLVRVSAGRPHPAHVGLVLVWSMPVVVAVQVWYWMTNFQNGVLNYVLTELAPRRLLPARLVRDAVLAARHGDAADRLGRAALRRRSRSTPGSRRCRASSSRRREIDGAGPLRVFRDVTFPVLKPILLILTSLSIIWDFGVFTQPYLLIGASHVDASNYLMGVYVFIEGYAHARLRARRGDLAPDAADGRRR